MNIKKATYSFPGKQLLALLLFAFSASLLAQNCPFCNKKLTEDHLCPDPTCLFYQDLDDKDGCDEGSPDMPPLIELVSPRRQVSVAGLCTSMGACAITTAQPLKPCKPKYKSSTPAFPWLQFVYDNALATTGHPGDLDGCRDAMRQQYKARDIALSRQNTLEPQIDYHFNSPNLLLLELTTREWSEDDNKMIETHYFYLFEINAQGGVYFLTDDEDTFGTQFVHPGRTNNYLHLLRLLEARLKPDDVVTLFIYRARN